jgi:hypothetical protein
MMPLGSFPARGPMRTTLLRGIQAAALTALLVASGCTGGPAGAPGPAGSGNGSGTIEWLAGPETETASDDVRQVLVDAFEQAYPSITMNLVTRWPPAAAGATATPARRRRRAGRGGAGGGAGTRTGRPAEAIAQSSTNTIRTKRSAERLPAPNVN